MAGYLALVIAVRGSRASVIGIGGTMCPSGFQPGGAATSSGERREPVGRLAGPPRALLGSRGDHASCDDDGDDDGLALHAAHRKLRGCESTSPQAPTR